MVFTSVTCAETSCAMSLSPVEMMTRRCSRVASAANVPITSSASTPATLSSGQPIARTISKMGSICTRRSSAMRGRLALYSAYISLRKVGPDASNTTATGLPS